MGKVILGMTMSLDGYINNQNGGLDELYADLFANNSSHDLEHETIKNNELFQEAISNTGAVILGKNAFMMAGDLDSYADTATTGIKFWLSR